MEAKNQSVLITGASSGIGAALAREFSERGYKVALLARRKDRVEKLAGELKRAHNQTLALQADVNDDVALQTAVSTIVKTWGSLDIVIANAGVGVVGSVDSLSVEDYRRQFETNVFGVLKTIYASLPELKRNRGRLAVVGSVNGYLALSGNSPYAMSKFAVRALCDSVRGELSSYGISVTHIAPGFVESEFRQVDNLGVHHSGHLDRVPKWIQMKADVAARKIASAVLARKAERIVTGHGHIVVFLRQHFPRFTRLVLGLFKVSARREASGSVTKPL